MFQVYFPITWTNPYLKMFAEWGLIANSPEHEEECIKILKDIVKEEKMLSDRIRLSPTSVKIVHTQAEKQEWNPVDYKVALILEKCFCEKKDT